MKEIIRNLIQDKLEVLGAQIGRGGMAVAIALFLILIIYWAVNDPVNPDAKVIEFLIIVVIIVVHHHSDSHSELNEPKIKEHTPPHSNININKHKLHSQSLPSTPTHNLKQTSIFAGKQLADGCTLRCVFFI